MALGFRVLKGHQRSDQSLVEAFSKIPTAIISDNLNRMVAAGPRIKPLHTGGGLAGTAVTVKTRPGDNLMIHKAADIAEPGDVLVVDGGEDLTNALIGELIVTHARSRGVVGFVINGAARDIDVIGTDVFPVYAGGISHRGPYKDGPGEVNVPIALDGMIIEPGDIVIGDLDGVVSIPRLQADTVLKACLQQVEKETGILQAIHGEGWDRRWVDEILKAKGCEGV
ncbi:RraA family protein [Halomonas dongshanensis]|uniref:Putative 4-hydroxy-4-methyl-2-oxoglutarate aldolase n=1 Tax=Halomonas dongshanensis TaxID=2890835 RepID=A0ABT2EDY5_9GAMM|nr:RraA family protein [Halomonas dongshanensis]